MSLFRYTRKTFARELMVMLVDAIWCVPFYVLVVVALKPSSELFGAPLSAPSHVAFGNFSSAWAGSAGQTLGDALKSSAIITAGSVAALIVIGSACAYTIARRDDRLGTGMYLLFVLAIVIPVQMGMIPTYVVLRKLGISGTYPAMILLYTGILLPLAVFLYTGFVRTLPKDYEEAAYIDGASRRRTFLRVIFPLLSPVTATVAVLASVIIWNDFFVQLVFLAGSPRQTLPVIIYSFVGQYSSQWNFIFAAVIISIAPVLAFYLFAQRQLVRGFTGGIKS